MERGDIYLVSSGEVENGRKPEIPVLIVSPSAFNEMVKVPIVVPVSPENHTVCTMGFAVRLSGQEILTKGIIRCDRPRALKLDSDNSRKLESVPVNVIHDVLARLSTILE